MVRGNLYKLEKLKVAVGTLTQLKAVVNIDSALIPSASAQAAEESKAGEYHVARLDQEDVPMTAVTAQNLRLLPSDASLENIESRMTSVSLGNKKGKAAPGASLTNVLRQALQSDDTDQLDWVITQSDPAMVEATLVQL